MADVRDQECMGANDPYMIFLISRGLKLPGRDLWCIGNKLLYPKKYLIIQNHNIAAFGGTNRRLLFGSKSSRGG